LDTSVSQGPSSLQHIRGNHIIVVDHLGRNIPIPTGFCSTWKDFNNIINGYCKNRAGSGFIERGDYRLIRSEDSQVISRSRFASTVVSGTTLEMSIVVRQESASGGEKEKCPRCRHINLKSAGNSRWIEWKVSPKFYAR